MSVTLSPIKLNTNTSQFFISVCMVKGHTMVTAGFTSKMPDGTLHTQHLFDVGKSIVLEKRKQGALAILWQMLRGTLDSSIQNERVFVDLKPQEPSQQKAQGPVKHPIEYMAFEITYKDYLSLLARLKKLNPEINAYIPDGTTKKDEVTLKFASLNTLNAEAAEAPDINAIQQTKNKLSFKNHCRLDAQRLLHSAFPKTSIDDFGMSQSIQGHLLCQSSITNGMLDKEIIILPPPPSSYNLGEKQTKILNKLYSRIEKILALNQDDELTKEKFAKTKELYKSIVEKESPSLDDVLVSIISWADKNQELVDKHRRSWSFFQPTATRSFVEEVRKEQQDSLKKGLT